MCFIVLVMARQVNSFVGITWGRAQSQQLVPSMVVDLLLQNNISDLRLMTSGYDIIEIFAATNITISVTLGNHYVWQANRKDLAFNWVNERIKSPINKGVKLKEIAIGAEPFSNTFLKEARNGKVVSVLKLIREVLDEVGLRDVKTTTTHGMDVLKFAKVPSDADFCDDIKEPMLESLEEFNRIGASFVLCMFPIYFVKNVMNYTNIEFAFFDNDSGLEVQDGNVTYTNVVELMIDSVAWTLKKAGYPNMKIVIGEIGWPTDGYLHANIKNAERFHKGLLKFIASEKGTPLRPGSIDIYLHSLSDENKFGHKSGAFQRHWGIYEADGNPKYKIDFSLQDRDLYPTQAKGIVKMPNRWCVFNRDRSNMTLVNKNYELACKIADCTPLEKGASCDKLIFQSKISYAFNAYFQKYKQDIKFCDFNGFGKIVTTNPSVENCEFPIEILAFQDQPDKNGMILRV
ncbi:hypothetical protein BC332_12635 [Capsicum chinense]|nr:hypothetical protein BC332_12635 [Capsicum chinense]